MAKELEEKEVKTVDPYDGSLSITIERAIKLVERRMEDDAALFIANGDSEVYSVFADDLTINEFQKAVDGIIGYTFQLLYSENPELAKDFVRRVGRAMIHTEKEMFADNNKQLDDEALTLLETELLMDEHYLKIVVTPTAAAPLITSGKKAGGHDLVSCMLKTLDFIYKDAVKTMLPPDAISEFRNKVLKVIEYEEPNKELVS